MEETKVETEFPRGGDQEKVASAAEFKKKYGKKRFTPKSAAKAVLYSFIYDSYQQNEGGITGSLYPDIREIQRQIHTIEDSNRWNNYIALIEWYQNAFNTAVFMRNALQSTLSDLDNITRGLIAGENLRREITGDQPDIVWLWLSSMTVENYSPQAHGSEIFTLRQNAEAGLLYVNAYNSFAELIAEVTDTPEATIFKVRMSRIWELIDNLNEALDMLRKDVAEHRAKELASGEGETRGLSMLWTPEYLEETMKAFKPLGKDLLEPVPKEKADQVKARIIRDIGSASLSWYAVFRAYSSDYWKKVRS